MKTLKIRNHRDAKWSFVKFTYKHEMITWLLLHDFIPTESNSQRWKHLWGQEEVMVLE